MYLTPYFILCAIVFFFLKNTTNENEKKYYNISYSMSNALSLYPINTDLTFAVLPPVLM